MSRETILNVILVRPSKYDEAGYVVRDWLGVMPSNSLAVLVSLLRDIQENQRLGAGVRIVLHVYDEAVQKVNPQAIARRCRRSSGRSLAMIVGVQTNQFVRTSDLALAFQRLGIQTIVGGFHVSGVLAQFPQNGDPVNTRAFRALELERLTAQGVSLFAGEAEGRMLEILERFLAGNLPRVMNYLKEFPDLTREPVPVPIPSVMKRFALPRMGTIDPSRGCPYGCTFCTVTTVQGRVVRARSVDTFIATIRANWDKGIRQYFFTADNASRDPFWRSRFEALIALRAQGICPPFIMQVDTLAAHDPLFVELAAKAGCAQVFVGLESMNPANLKAVEKRQNLVADMPAFVKAFRDQGISVHFGYMIGLPHDTAASVADDVQALIALGPDLVSFFVNTPLPGSEDHRRLFVEGAWLDPDLNAYDASRPVCHHPRMSDTEWRAAYEHAWRTFLSVPNMIAILRRGSRSRYWSRFFALMWYAYALEVAQCHPMLSGFLRRRDRRSRRETSLPQSPWAFLRNEMRESILWLRCMRKLILDLTEVWLQTRERGALEQRVTDLLAEKVQMGGWLNVRLNDLRECYRKLGRRSPSNLTLFYQRCSLRTTRSDIQEHWRSVAASARRGKLWLLVHRKTFLASVSDSIVISSFFRTFLLRSWRGRL